MPRIIVIGECTIDVIFPQATESTWPLDLTGRPAGRLFNAAAMLARRGHEVTFVGEAARDRLGGLLVGYLEQAGVDTHCIDRFSDGGITASNFVIPAEGTKTDIIANRRFPDGEKFNATWPRIDAGNIVVFGGYFSIDDRSRSQVMEMLQYAADRHAIIVYLPGFAATLVPRITRVMPAILENLEIADVVITRTDDLSMIFGTDDPLKCYQQNIRFYCRTMVDLDRQSGNAVLFHNDQTATSALDAAADTLEGQSAAVARLVSFMAEGGFTCASVDGMSLSTLRDMADAIASAANTASV